MRCANCQESLIDPLDTKTHLRHTVPPEVHMICVEKAVHCRSYKMMIERELL